jgi:hypothetical protein
MESLQDDPGLRPFILSKVRFTGSRIGAGAYGSVEEVTIPGTVCAAKKIHDIFQDRSEIPAAEIRKASTQFVKECQLMSTLRHPHIVQFLGVCFFSGLATACASHGATADKPSRLTGPRNGFPASTKHA